MNQIRNSFTSIEQVTGQYLNRTSSTEKDEKQNGVRFEDLLKQQISAKDNAGELKFSKHASMRLDERDISLSKEQNERLQAGVQKAGEKGIKESLVLVDSLAFVVNVPNHTVVTAMDRAESVENIFTNIDGAVII